MLISFSLKAQEVADSTYEHDALERLTALLNLKMSDIAFRDDYTEKDVHRLQAVADLMAHPYGMIAFTEGMKDNCSGGNPGTVLKYAFKNLKKVGQESKSRNLMSELPSLSYGSINMYYNSDEFNQLLLRARSYLNEILPAAADSSLALLSKSEKVFLLHRFKEALLEDTADEFRSVEELDSIQQAEEEYIQQFVEFSHKIRIDYLLNAGVQTAIDLFEEINLLTKEINKGNFDIGRILADTTALPMQVGRAEFLGRHSGWKIGGLGNDVYSGDYEFIFDFGGDDYYDLTYDPDNPHSCIIIDLSGNDIYTAKSEFCLGSGCFSAGFLFDLGGDDVYKGSNFSCGSGYFGLGLLYDANGFDQYYGDIHAQGAATFGIGIIIDKTGNDIYSAALSSQGYGMTEGFGSIIDIEGKDTYIAGTKYKESIGLAGVNVHYLTLSQGFGQGLRPYTSGGIGSILDYEGNDNYLTDIYGQGSSYWWSLGLLYDGGGNDQYVSYQYAQGAGIHMSCGILLDQSGDDFYRGKGLMQGCGHDYGCGLILDRNGSDTYQASDLSQAAGSANGIGIFIDDRGDDTYYVKKASNTRGYGNPRREFGSIGLFADLNGTDNYVGGGENNSYWQTDSKWGGGFDIELIPSESDSTEEEKDKPVVKSPQGKTVVERVDYFFVMASSGELKYRDMVQPAMDSLIAMGKAAVPRILEKIDTKDARESHAINSILVGIGSAALPDLLKNLIFDDTLRVSRVCRALGEIGDSSAVNGLINISNHSDWRVRSGAAVALGKIGDSRANETITGLLDDSDEMVRKSAAVSCGRLKTEEAIDKLVHLLGDSFYGAALTASETLQQFGEIAINPIADSLNSSNDLLVNLAIRTLGKIGGYRAAVAVASQLTSTLPIRRALAVEAIRDSNSSAACGFAEIIEETETDPTVLYYIKQTLDKYAEK